MHMMKNVVHPQLPWQLWVHTFFEKRLSRALILVNHPR